MKSIKLAIIASAALAASAQASDNTENFVGPRAEVMIGYEHLTENTYPTKEDGVAFAGAIGYDVRLAKDVVVGADLEIGDSSTSKILSPTLQWNTGRTIYGGARIGLAINPKTQMYVKGGFANSEVRLVNSGTTFYTGEVEGVRVGAGFERLISNKVFLKGEYRYTNQENTIESHQAMAGVGVRF